MSCPGYADNPDDCDEDVDTNTAVWLDTDGSPTDQTAALTGTADAPATATFSDEGELVFCDGTFYVNLLFSGSVVVKSDSGDAMRVTLDGGDLGTVIEVDGENIEVDVRDLTVQGGYGTSDVYSGTASLTADSGWSFATRVNVTEL